MSRYSVEKFLSDSKETFCRKTHLSCVSKNFWWRKSLWIRGVAGDYLNFPSKKFLSHSTGTFRRGTLKSFNSSRYRKYLCFRRFYHDFRLKTFRPTLPKPFVEEPFCALIQKLSGSKKVYGKEGWRGEYRNFASKNLCLKLPKHFVGEPFRLSLVSGVENIYASEGYNALFRRKFFVSQCQGVL